MRCFICAGSYENNKTSTFMAYLEERSFIVKNVPSLVCDQCGEISFSHEVVKKKSELIRKMKTESGEIIGADYETGEIVTADFDWSKKNDMITNFVESLSFEVSKAELDNIDSNKALHLATG